MILVGMFLYLAFWLGMVVVVSMFSSPKDKRRGH
jgi:hypothetical protein